MLIRHHFNADKYQNHIANQTHMLTNVSHSFIVWSPKQPNCLPMAQNNLWLDPSQMLSQMARLITKIPKDTMLCVKKIKTVHAL